VLTTVTAIEREARSEAGHTYVVRVGPYRTAGKRDADGVVVTFVDISAIKAAEEALRASEARLEEELNVMRRLHEMTVSVATASSVHRALEQVLAAAVDLHKADFGTVQLLDAVTQQLSLVVQQGFDPTLVGRSTPLGAEDSVCQALRNRRVWQVEDVTTGGSRESRRASATGGYRAVQSMPLIGTSAQMVGALSVHFRTVHAFTERDRQLGDMLGRVAADLLQSRLQRERLPELHETQRQQATE
jgi:PAS domain-containing protein